VRIQLTRLLVCAMPFLASTMYGSIVFDSASLSFSNAAQSPITPAGLSTFGPSSFSSAPQNSNVVPNSSNSVGLFTNTVTYYAANPALAPTSIANTNGSGVPITLTLTYTIGGTNYTGMLNGNFVESGWAQSPTSLLY
jgi:hypothetical protein